MIKRIIKLISFCSIILCVLVAIKSPDTYIDMLGISDNNVSKSKDVPYFINFGQLRTKNDTYQSQYITYDSRNWYCSHGSNNDNYDFVLGWDNQNRPQYGNYKYIDNVMRNVVTPSGITVNYTYLLMDFDLKQDHNIELKFNVIDNLSTLTNSKVYIIKSINSGLIYNQLNDYSSLDLVNKNNITYKYTHISDDTQVIRYGILLVSENATARINIHTFYAYKV